MIADMAETDFTPYQYMHSVAQRRALHHAYLFLGADDQEMNACARSVIDMFSSAQSIDCQPEETGGSISIVQVRELIFRLSRANPEGQVTFVVIAQARSMTREAGNALLKILEEPPRDVVFILFAKSVRDLLPTIVSRCHMVRFALRRQPLSHQGNCKKICVLMDAGFETQLSLAETVSVDDFDAYEESLSGEIRSGADSVGLGRVLEKYEGLRLAYRANRSHVNPQGCIDLLYL
jgi:hypothetical protein